MGAAVSTRRRRLGWGCAGTGLVLVAVACSSGSAAHPSSKAAASASAPLTSNAPRLASAPAATLTPQHAVGTVTQTLVDTSRPTPPHLGVAGLPSRTLPTTIWYPAEGTPGSAPVAGARPDRADGPYRLIVFAHGLAATPQFYETLLSRWAAAGFVVAGPLFPLTHAGTLGGLDQDDQVNQPADVRFIITSMLAAGAGTTSPLGGMLSPSEIGVSGQSDGAVTVLAFLNSCCTDARVKAVEVISGDPEAYPNGEYRTRGNPATLIAHRTLDPLLPYNQMVSFFNMLTGPKAFLSMVGADHTDYLTPGKWFDSVLLSTVDFWRTYLQGSQAAAGQLPDDGQPGATVMFSAPAPGASLAAPLLPEPKTDRHASLSASTNLSNGQTITVSWSGYLPGKIVNVVECSSSSETGCDVAAGRIPCPTAAAQARSRSRSSKAVSETASATPPIHARWSSMTPGSRIPRPPSGWRSRSEARSPRLGRSLRRRPGRPGAGLVALEGHGVRGRPPRGGLRRAPVDRRTTDSRGAAPPPLPAARAGCGAPRRRRPPTTDEIERSRPKAAPPSAAATRLRCQPNG
jgi:dienelactone hydrolase